MGAARRPALLHLAAILVVSASCGRSGPYELGAGFDPGSSADRCDAGATLSADLSGQPVFAILGAPWPAGRYRVAYRDGCMKYAPDQAWAVNAYASGHAHFWLVDGSNSRLQIPPGTIGFLVGQGGFASFSECVTANRALPPLEFDFAGGELGLWLQDHPYDDNIAGEAGRNPTWNVSALTCR